VEEAASASEERTPCQHSLAFLAAAPCENAPTTFGIQVSSTSFEPHHIEPECHCRLGCHMPPTRLDRLVKQSTTGAHG
jgi:hypothetical protein